MNRNLEYIRIRGVNRLVSDTYDQLVGGGGIPENPDYRLVRMRLTGIFYQFLSEKRAIFVTIFQKSGNSRAFLARIHNIEKFTCF